jgi:uncharacterized protein YndB with AHSA1/START domain
MAARSNALTADSAERVLIIERIFDAPRELVFKCWTEPEHLARWIGPRGFSSTILACELRQGGNYRMHMRGPDGQDHWQQGVFREIVPPERIVRTYCWTDAEGKITRPETLLTVTFADLGGRTKLTLHQAVFESVTACDAHRGGWTSSLERLAEYLAAAQSNPTGGTSR